MIARNLLANISRQFFKDKKICTYRMKKLADMTDEDVITYCHYFCEENKLTEEFNAFREKEESQYYYCSYLQEYLDPGYCYDMQMIVEGFIKRKVLSEIHIDKTKLSECCSSCKHCL